MLLQKTPNAFSVAMLILSILSILNYYFFLKTQSLKLYGTADSQPAPHCLCMINGSSLDDVIKWKHFPCYWPFVWEIHRSPVNSPQKGQWRGALMLSLICAWINGRISNREAGDLRRHRAHYDGIVMSFIWRGSATAPYRCHWMAKTANTFLCFAK